MNFIRKKVIYIALVNCSHSLKMLRTENIALRYILKNYKDQNLNKLVTKEHNESMFANLMYILYNVHIT